MSGGISPMWLRAMSGIFALTIAISGASMVRAQSEEDIKAAFLLNFARYVEWPTNAFTSPESPVLICMFASEGFGSVVTSTVDGKTVGSRPVEVLDVASATNAGDCHILFIGGEARSATSVLGSLSDASVFTVGNDEGFAKAGGVANFFRSENRIRFEINPGAAETAGLKISSRLLRLARLVE
jgi:YfiR/HmsC-like